MTKTTRRLRVLVGGVFAVISLPLWGQQLAPQGAPDEDGNLVSVALFDAIGAGQVEVRVVPHNYSMMTVRVQNLTQFPLKVALPSTFAAVPVVRQAQAQQSRGYQGGYGMQGNLGGNYNQGGGSQGLGGSLGGPWWGESLATGRVQDDPPAQQPVEQPAIQQYLMIPPGRYVQAQVPCFCLEFGKPDPNSRIPYVICSLDQLNDRPAVAELLEQFSRQGVNQCVAQLAAWHLASDVPWPMLAQVQFPRTRNSRAHRVTPMELMAARRLAEAMPSYGQQSLSGRGQ